MEAEHKMPLAKYDPSLLFTKQLQALSHKSEKREKIATSSGKLLLIPKAKFTILPMSTDFTMTSNIPFLELIYEVRTRWYQGHEQYFVWL